MMQALGSGGGREDAGVRISSKACRSTRFSAICGCHETRVRTVTSLARRPYAGVGPIRQVIKDAFNAAGLPASARHSFHQAIMRQGEHAYPTRRAPNAFSDNTGQDVIVTTVSA
ncbi:hypothetical protein [Roseovarius sp.]